ncbi:MAG: hypothetical protein D4R68_02285 [Ignavibacteriales bacterium]|nr:MAG: hypothetical protein D4R68_02285 [Ignavibacteriales bacterium]
MWVYDDETLIQKLSFFQAICPLCHEVKHFGLAAILGNETRALDRFEKVNRLDKETAKKIMNVVIKERRIRSKQKWNLDITLLEEFEIDINNLQNKSKLKRYRSLKTKSEINDKVSSG